MNSIVEFYPEDDRHRCGYCKSENGSVANGMWAHSLSVRNYQDLLDRGWRRSGKYCYKPIMRNTCCPLYTIKCDAVNFKLSKSQKKILRKVAKFLREGTPPRSVCEDRDSSSGYLSEHKMLKRVSGKCSTNVQGIDSFRDDTISDFTSTVTTSADAFTSRTHHSSGVITESKAGGATEKSEKTVITESKTRSGLGRDPSKPQCQKARLVRQQKKIKKLEEQGDSVLSVVTSSTTSSNSQGKSLEDFIMESAEGDLKNTLILRLVPAESTPDMLNKCWQLYVKYQMVVHKEKEEECSFSSFKQFLVDSPLQFYRDETTPSCGFGSFHHQYWLNGVLIAVGVIDILPECVSSVYFFYDPAYSHLSLGTYGALREIELVRTLSKQRSSLSNYYMGYYIDTCPKMRYKGRFGPSYLLCPEEYTWHPLEECLEKIKKEKYTRFNNLDPEGIPGNVNAEKVVILWRRQVMEYKQYEHSTRPSLQERNDIQKYANLVGEDCCKRILLYKSA